MGSTSLGIVSSNKDAVHEVSRLHCGERQIQHVGMAGAICQRLLETQPSVDRAVHQPTLRLLPPHCFPAPPYSSCPSRLLLHAHFTESHQRPFPLVKTPYCNNLSCIGGVQILNYSISPCW